MIFDLTKNYVPEVYRESRDYRIFLRMLGMLVSVNKDNIDSFINLYNAESCPDNLLPLLGNTLGYKYNENLSIDANRIIIKYYPTLLRNKGSEVGLKLAIALSTNLLNSSGLLISIPDVPIQYDKEKGIIKIYYDNSTDLINWDLIDLVRPVGMQIEFISSDVSGITSEFRLKATVKAHTNLYNPDDYQVNKSKVGFSDNFNFVSTEEEEYNAE